MTEPGNEKSVWNYVIVNNDAMVKEMVIYEDRNIKHSARSRIQVK